MASGLVLTYRSDIEEKLNAKKSELVETEETLKKYVGPLVGGDLSSRPSFRGRLGPPPQRENNPRIQQDGSQRRSIGRGRLSLEGRLGPKINDDDEGDENDGKEDIRKVMSRVVVDQKTREEALAEKKVDRTEVQRNKRMFGNLLGTLQKFRQDESKIKDREQKKRKIEEKIEEKSEKEREDAKLKKRELFTEREKKKHELKVLEIQMKRVEEFESWEKNKRQESLYIRTKKGLGPHIYFLPKEHNKGTLEALKECKASIEAEIAEAKIRFEDDILKIGAKAENLHRDPELEDEEEEEDDLKNLSVISAVQRPDKTVTTPEKNAAISATKNVSTDILTRSRRKRSSDSSSSDETKENETKNSINNIKKEKIEEDKKKDDVSPTKKVEQIQTKKDKNATEKDEKIPSDDDIPLPPDVAVKIEKDADKIVPDKKESEPAKVVSAVTVQVVRQFETPVVKDRDIATKDSKSKPEESKLAQRGNKPERKRAASSSSSSDSGSSSDDSSSSSSSDADDRKKKKSKKTSKSRSSKGGAKPSRKQRRKSSSTE